MDERTIIIPVPDEMGKHEFFEVLISAVNARQAKMESWVEDAPWQNDQRLRAFWSNELLLVKEVKKCLWKLRHNRSF